MVKRCSRHSIKEDELQNIKLNDGGVQIIVTEKGDSVIIEEEYLARHNT